MVPPELGEVAWVHRSPAAAGVAGGGPVHLLDRTEWERVVGTNLTGTFLVAKAALARMIEQDRVDGERGSIVTVASIEGLEGTAGNECYDAGTTNKKLLAQSARNAIKAEALYNEVLQRIRAIDGKVPVTTTTVGNSGNSGGIFG